MRNRILFFLSAAAVAAYLWFLFLQPVPPKPTTKTSFLYAVTVKDGKMQIVQTAPLAAAQVVEEPQRVNREHKTDPLMFLIYIHDGPSGGEVTAPMGRRQAEAELNSLYKDADAEILLPDGRGGYMFAPANTSKRIQRLVLGGPDN